MATIIVTGTENRDSLASALRTLANTHVITLATDSTITSSLKESLASVRDSKILIVDGTMEIDAITMAEIISFTERQLGSSFVYTPISAQGETIDLPDISVDNLLNAITTTEYWPLLCCGVSKELLTHLAQTDIENTNDLLAVTLVQAITSGENVSACNQTLTVKNREQLRLSDRGIVSCLHTAVNQCNIEELFPQHPWKEHQGECAAASYHTLAAIFMRYGNYDLANQALTLSDSFEDSPRSLALKGLIARDRGEILGAVANLISSLQQYELRKKDETTVHYLHFQPKDFELINSSLRAGLAALNKRDNETAVEYFSEAIFSFDSFYGDLGVDRSKN